MVGQAGMAEGNQWDAPRQGRGFAIATLFGRFQLRTSDGSEVVISNRRARALLAMLCLARGEAIDRDFLSKLLWAAHFGRGELDDALKAAQRVVDLGWPSTYLALTSAALGNNDLAIEQYQLSKRLVNSVILPPVGSGTISDEAMDAYWLIGAKGICGGLEADRQSYGQVLKMMYATLHDKADMAICSPAIFTGNSEMVFKTFGHHLTPANITGLLVLWADIDPIRRVWQHPEFIPFAQRIGMAAAWDKYGWPDLLPPPSNRAPA